MVSGVMQIGQNCVDKDPLASLRRLPLEMFFALLDLATLGPSLGGPLVEPVRAEPVKFSLHEHRRQHRRTDILDPLERRTQRGDIGVTFKAPEHCPAKAGQRRCKGRGETRVCWDSGRGVLRVTRLGTDRRAVHLVGDIVEVSDDVLEDLRESVGGDNAAGAPNLEAGAQRDVPALLLALPSNDLQALRKRG